MKVFSSDSAMVADLQALSAGARRFIGRKHDPNAGLAGGWAVLDVPQEVPAIAEYILAVRHGDLLPADEETAKICGVKFAKLTKKE